uniref:Uncharacterized protein n=1 Tax=Octopus bimaculoides TaxID=37653 RepID=A0A0L8I8D4_OCTBM
MAVLVCKNCNVDHMTHWSKPMTWSFTCTYILLHKVTTTNFSVVNIILTGH